MGNGYELQDGEAWIFVLKYLSPLAKLILGGRRHQLMVGPELLAMEHELKRIGFNVSFDPMYEFTTEEDDTADYYRQDTREHFKCDFCSEQVARGEGRLLGPWQIRRDLRLAQLCILGLGDGDLGLARFRKDWSHWHACPECLEKFVGSGGQPA